MRMSGHNWTVICVLSAGETSREEGAAPEGTSQTETEPVSESPVGEKPAVVPEE